jgi:membrane protein required for colicin V production
VTAFDIVVLIAIGLSAIAALSRGFVTELISLAAWVAAWIATKIFFVPVQTWMRTQIESKAGADILAFALIFFGVLIAVRMLANFAGGQVKKSAIGIVDRIMGAVFGAIRGLLIISAVYALFGLLVARDKMPDWIQNAKFKPLVDFAADTVVSTTKALRGKKGTIDVPPAPGAAPPADTPPDEGYDSGARGGLDDLIENQDTSAVPNKEGNKP